MLVTYSQFMSNFLESYDSFMIQQRSFTHMLSYIHKSKKKKEKTWMHYCVVLDL